MTGSAAATGGKSSGAATRGVGVEGLVMPCSAVVDAAVARMRLLSDPTRVRVVCALVQGEVDVGCLAELAGAPPAAVSQHLAKLRLAGVVRCRRVGQRVLYELVDAALQGLAADLLGSRGDALSVMEPPPRSI